MFIHPNISPIALQIGLLKIHWYGIMYVFAYISFILIIRKKLRLPKYTGWMSNEKFGELSFAIVLGVILGGRIGYVLLYNFSGWLGDPLSLFRIWEGGMSSHGGFIGVVLAFFWFSYWNDYNPIDVADFMLPAMPIGLFFGRIGNFINQELYGTVTEMPWGVVFPMVDSSPRHPSQLYEGLLEGLFLFFLLMFVASKYPRRYFITGLGMFVYGFSRIVVEFVRVPDAHLGYVLFETFSMGQILSFPLLIVGIWFMALSRTEPGVERYSKLVKRGRLL